MKHALQILLLCLLVAAPVVAGEDAIVVRQAVVYTKASSTSAEVGQIEAGSRVSIFSRKGGWKEIFSEEKAIIGWVRSYQVREGDYAPTIQTETASDSRGFLAGLASFSRKASRFFSSDNRSTSSGTATIGVRGLSEVEIKAAVPDPEQLGKMQGFASNSSRAVGFASQGGLRAQKIPHISGPK